MQIDTVVFYQITDPSYSAMGGESDHGDRESDRDNPS